MAGSEIYDLLKDDHREVESLFEKIMAAKGDALTADGPAQPFEELSRELTVHMRAEEQVFYGALQGKEETRDLVSEAHQEHKAGEQLLRKTTWVPMGSDDWRSAVGEAQKAFKQHIVKEEANLLSAARKILSDRQARDMGDRFEQQKRSFKGQRAA